MKSFVGMACLTMVALTVCAQEDQLTESLANGGFEQPSITSGALGGSEPEGWFYFCSTSEKRSGISGSAKKEGSQSLLFRAQSMTNAYEGYAFKFLAKSGNHYTFTVHVTPNPDDPMVAGAYGQISFEFRDETGKEIQRVHGPIWGVELPSGKWEKFLVEADGPEGAASGSAVLSFFSFGSGGAGSFYVDEAELSVRPVGTP